MIINPFNYFNSISNHFLLPKTPATDPRQRENYIKSSTTRALVLPPAPRRLPHPSGQSSTSVTRQIGPVLISILTCSFAPLCVATMALSFAPSLLVLATLIALVLPQLGLCAATLTPSEGQENVDTSLSTPTLTHDYDVFVSFRGDDIRTNFKAYLLAAFDLKRIRAFRDDVDLRRGAEIGPELLKAIETSRIAVVVFTKNYATSSWCLDELVKIMECKKLLYQRVLPIYYDVSQSEVQDQKGIFVEALLKGPEDKVNNWRAALMEAADLAGLQLEKYR